MYICTYASMSVRVYCTSVVEKEGKKTRKTICVCTRKQFVFVCKGKKKGGSNLTRTNRHLDVKTK